MSASATSIESDFVGIKEAAKRLGCSERLVYALTEKGDLPCVRMGSKKLVPRAAIDGILEAAMANFDPAKALVALGKSA